MFTAFKKLLYMYVDQKQQRAKNAPPGNLTWAGNKMNYTFPTVVSWKWLPRGDVFKPQDGWHASSNTVQLCLQKVMVDCFEGLRKIQKYSPCWVLCKLTLQHWQFPYLLPFQDHGHSCIEPWPQLLQVLCGHLSIALNIIIETPVYTINWVAVCDTHKTLCL